MNRPLWLGVGLILASNAVALAGVWYNRSGEPQAQLQLSEREIQLPYDSWLRGEENSGLRLQLAWRQADADWSWLDEAKLRELGFAPNDLGRSAERPLWLVLELDGPSYRKQVERAKAERAYWALQRSMVADDAPRRARLRRRVGTEDGRGLHLSAQQAYAVAVLQVDGGIKDHGTASWFADRASFAMRTGGTEGRAAT